MVLEENNRTEAQGRHRPDQRRCQVGTSPTTTISTMTATTAIGFIHRIESQMISATRDDSSKGEKGGSGVLRRGCNTGTGPEPFLTPLVLSYFLPHGWQ